MPLFIDLTNRKFSRLTVIKQAPHIKQRFVAWLCRCKCGRTTIVRSGSLTGGQTRSCGCLIRDTCIARSTTHGHNRRGKRTPVYNTWALMLDRCVNPKNARWCDYGGRGIRVCKRWLTFSNFLADMGERSTGMSIERKDVNGDYKKSNCRWVPMREQVFNRRDTVRVTINRKEMPAKHAAAALGVPWRTFIRHVHKYGAEKAKELARQR